MTAVASESSRDLGIWAGRKKKKKGRKKREKKHQRHGGGEYETTRVAGTDTEGG